MDYRVLVVEDHREIARSIRSGFESLELGFKVSNVLSGEEAFLEVQLQEFDLLVSKIRLPGISGLELMSKLHNSRPGLKVILISGKKDSKLKQKALDAGVDAFFYQPLEIADFLDTVEHILGLVGSASKRPPNEDIPGKRDSVPAEKGVSDRLANLRQELDAVTTIMLSDRGQIMVQAGDLPASGIETVFPSLMSAFSASRKISRYLGMLIPESLCIFNGSEYDLVMAHIGESYALLVVTNSSPTRERVGKISEIVGQGVKDLLGILAGMGVPLHSHEDSTLIPPLVTLVGDEGTQIELDESLDALLNQIENGVEVEDLDLFWEPTGEQTGSLVNADALSYEQALQLGLAPGEE